MAAKRKRGRPSTYSEKIAAEFCERLALGETSIKICKDKHMPERKTLWNWEQTIPGFLTRTREARIRQADSGFEQIQEVAVDTLNNPNVTHENIGAAKLYIDANKWRVGKLNRELYGENAELRLARVDALPIAASHADIEHLSEADQTNIRELAHKAVSSKGG